MPTKVIMPQLGESVVEGKVSKWLKKVGDPVQEFEPILEVSTDKVDTEIPAPAAGVILQIYVPEGTTVERGVLLAMIGKPGEAVPDAPAQSGAGAQHGQAGQKEAIETIHTPGHTHGNGGSQSQRYSPVVARMAAENHIDLAQISGTGLGGRVTKKDVEAFLTNREKSQADVKAAEVPPWEQPVEGDLFKPTDEVFAKASGHPLNNPMHATPAAPSVQAHQAPAPKDRPGQLIPHSTMRRTIAEHMVRSQLHTAPHVTTVFELDVSKTVAHWQAHTEEYAKQGVKLTLTAYFVMAIVQAAHAQPILNAQWTDEGLFVHQAVNVGMAVALPEGLIVPVIKNAQDLNLMGLARQVSDLATRARTKVLHPDEVSGGTITLTNHGVTGSLLATPIINQPQSAIVGTGLVQKRPIVLPDSDSIAIRPMMYATLTFDHRVADGAMADAFMRVFKSTLEDWA